MRYQHAIAAEYATAVARFLNVHRPFDAFANPRRAWRLLPLRHSSPVYEASNQRQYGWWWTESPLWKHGIEVEGVLLTPSKGMALAAATSNAKPAVRRAVFILGRRINLNFTVKNFGLEH